MFEVTKDKAQQFKVLSSLMKDKRVTELVCATDAGREGELIFRLVYNKAGCTKPFKRLWISSLEDSAIREGFNHLRDGKEFDRLYEAALSRSKACLLYTSHPKYRQLSDYDKRNTFDIEKYRKHKLVVKPDDTFDLYDMGEVEAD